MELHRHGQQQEEYFGGRVPPTMVPRPSAYLDRHLREIVRFGGISRSERLLEIGCGMGRYTLLFSQLGYRIEGLDVAPTVLTRLRAYTPPGREIPLHLGDAADPPRHLHGQFDVVLGLFMLHHVEDLRACFTGVARLLRPGGRAVFLEPNAFNPLFYAQIALTPGMTWAGDGGIRHMRRSVLFPAMAAAGLRELALERFGFLPPFVVNQRMGAQIEQVLEKIPVWRPLLPFQLIRGLVV